MNNEGINASVGLPLLMSLSAFSVLCCYNKISEANYEAFYLLCGSYWLGCLNTMVLVSKPQPGAVLCVIQRRNRKGTHRAQEAELLWEGRRLEGCRVRLVRFVTIRVL